MIEARLRELAYGFHVALGIRSTGDLLGHVFRRPDDQGWSTGERSRRERKTGNHEKGPCNQTCTQLGHGYASPQK